MIRTFYQQFANTETYQRILFRNCDKKENKIYFIKIDPMEVKNICLIPEHSTSLTGHDANIGISGGCWDYLKKPIKDHYLSKTVAEILKGSDFENTELYLKVKKGIITEREAIRLYKKINRIINILTNEKYKPQYDLHKFHSKLRLGTYKVPFHEMVVGMDRSGQLMRMIGGKHRIAVAQQVGVEKMYAVLGFIHEKSKNKLPEYNRLITGNDEDFKAF